MMNTVSKCSALIFILIASLGLVMRVWCVELDVGGEKGWATPSPKNVQFYNDWASSNRFKVNDTLRFEYKKDSVMVVTEQEYEKCRSSHPVFFSNNGDTAFTLDQPGLFYFISGVAGHCQRGLKMIVKVLEPVEPPPQVSNQTAPHHKNSAAAHFLDGPGSFMVLPIAIAVCLVICSFSRS